MHEITIWSLVLVPLLGFIAVLVLVNTSVTCTSCNTTYWFRPKKCKKCGCEFVSIKPFVTDFDKTYWQSFAKRWLLFLLVGIVIVTIFFPEENMLLVKAGNAPLNKYLYAIGASAIIALMAGKK
jgi:hypothetical protein